MEQLKYITEIPVIEAVDVLVIGAGPAGFPAAITAARNGAKTMLIDQNGVVGGMAAVGLVGPFMTSYDTTGETQIIRGIFDELVRRMEARGGAIHPSKVRAGTSYASFISPGHDHVTPFDPEWLKIVAGEMVEEAGVILRLHTQFIDLFKEENRITGVIVSDKPGLKAIRAKIIVDCTGDADVAVQAGAQFVLGRSEDNSMQPASMFFRIGNVDSEKVKAYIQENRHLIAKPFQGPFSWLIREARQRGEWNIARDEIGMYELPTPGEWRINTTRVLNIDGTKVEDLTKAELEGRKQARFVFEFLKKHVPGYENARFMDTGAVIGIRETRHIQGEYVITKEDVLDGVVFDDAIMLASNSIDIHYKNNEGGEYTTVRNGKWYGIPYRSLVPLGIDNLLVAGRPISATSDAVSAFRVMTCCIGIGEAAGTAAALAVKAQVEPRRLDVRKLQAQLKTQGVFLG